MKTKILILILVIAALLRFVGTYPGYYPNHPDEDNIYSLATNIFKTGSLKPLRYEYPPLPGYINTLFFRFFFIPTNLFRYYISNLGQVLDGTLPLNPTPPAFVRLLQLEIFGHNDINALFWTRDVTALFGVLIVFVFFKIGSKLYNSGVGLLAAFLIAINFRQVFNSHFILPDIYNAFFLGLALWMILRVWEKPNFKNYLLASIACGLSFATKYQFFSFIPFLLVHLFISLESKNFADKIKTFFSPQAFIVPFVIGIVFLICNPFLFIHWAIAGPQLAYLSLKYGIGRKIFDFYPISYLYHFGIGEITSFLLLAGLLISVFKNFKKTLFLLSAIIPFFFITIYYTSGGFYTRNFVTITPILLIFSAILLEKLIALKSKTKYISYIVFVIILVAAGIENLRPDYLVDSRYIKPWNRTILPQVITNIIPKGSSIAAHSSVPLPENYYQVVPYDFNPAFSIEEFKEEKAEWAITNFEWASNDFYGWMVQDTVTSLRYWNKPVKLLEETYPALALRELQDFSVFSLINSPFAPDSNFLVAHLPIYKVTDKKLITGFNFRNGNENWTKKGDEALLLSNGGLEIIQGGSNTYTRWESPVVEINTNGFEIDYSIQTSEESPTPKREGFILISFYKSLEDAKMDTNRIAVRLSPRNDIYNKWVNANFSGNVPTDARFAKVGFQVYNSSLSKVDLNNLKIYAAEVQNQTKGTKHIDVNTDIIFPNSQGNM